jgi:hypothetical protein
VKGLHVTSGTSGATFSGSNDSAIVVGNSGRTIFNAFPNNALSDASTGQLLYYNEIDTLLNPSSSSIASGADFNQPQIRDDAYSPPFHFTDRDSAKINLTYDLKTVDGRDTTTDNIDVTLVHQNSSGQIVDVATLWTFFYGNNVVPFPIRISGLDDFGQIQNNTTYRLRIRYSDGDKDLTSTSRVEVDDLNITNAVLEGDYNGDGAVNAADYVTWRSSSINGQAGYTAWRSSFGADARATASGAGAQANSTVVPEPTTFISLAVAAVGAGSARRRRSYDGSRSGFRTGLLNLPHF